MRRRRGAVASIALLRAAIATTTKPAASASTIALADAAPRPLVYGRHLLALGHKPGPEFKPVLDAAFAVHKALGPGLLESVYEACLAEELQQAGFAVERQAAHSVIETTRSSGHGSQSVIGSVMGTPAYMPPD